VDQMSRYRNARTWYAEASPGTQHFVMLVAASLVVVVLIALVVIALAVFGVSADGGLVTGNACAPGRLNVPGVAHVSLMSIG
jgi:hypothetical protein